MRGTRTAVVTDTVLLGWLTLRTLCGVDSGQKVKLRGLIVGRTEETLV